LPSVDEQQAANQLRQIIASNMDGDSTLRLLNDEREATEVTLTPAMSGLMMELLRHIGRGDAVTLVPFGQMLTTQQAADILNVSRPYLVSLLEKKDIPHTKVGRHRRVRAEDLFSYKEERDSNRSKALSDLAEMDGEYI